MELQDLKKLAEQGFFTDITAYEHYANNEEELQSLTTAQLAEMGFISQVDKASTPDPEPEEMVTITFNTTPPEATIEIDGEPLEGKSTQVKKGETITYTAKASGYNDKTDSVQADSTKEVPITLIKKQYDFTINATPSDATVTINDEQVKTKKVEHGTRVTWKVEKENYTPQEGTEESVTQNVTKEITLELVNHTFTINATPEGATVTINGEPKKTLTAPHGTEVRWSVTMEGYTEQSGTETLNDDVTKEIELVASSAEPEVVAAAPRTRSKKS